MTKAFIKKNTKLSLEFDEYVARHPEIFEKIPNGSYVFITINGDEKFNTDSYSLVKDLDSNKVVEAHKTTGSWNVRPLVATG